MRPPPVHAISSALHPDDLARLVTDQYPGLGAVRRLVFLKRWIADTYLVHAAAGPAVLRVYRAGWRTRPQIDAELAVLNQLAAAGIPVSVPIPAASGELVHPLSAPEGERHAAVFTFAPGRSLYSNEVPRVDCAGLYGGVIGAVHAELAASPPAGLAARPALDAEALIIRPARAVAPYLEHRPRDLDALARDARRLADEIERRAGGPPAAAVHGDVDPANVHFGPGGEPVLFDFDFFGPGYPAYDIAVPLWEFAWSKWPPEVGERWLAGYISRRGGPAPDMPLVRALLPVRGIWFLGLVAENAAGWGAGVLLSDAAIDAHLEVFGRWLADV